MRTVSCIDLLQTVAPGIRPPLRPALVFAHPDDEVLGAGSLLKGFGRTALFLCLTDGSPRDLQDARKAGFRTREEYAEARRRESESVMTIAGIRQENWRNLEIVDQEASYNLVGIVRELLAAFREFQPNLILTHPYEGGHPDHDAAAFASYAAAAIFRQLGGEISVAEFTSYNAGPQGDGWRTDFLPHPDSPVVRIELSEDERALKRRMLKCYVSQKWILDAFPANVECFRPAPAYDFTRAPHEGRLFYERFEWGLTGSHWRALAEKAGAELGIR